MLPFFAGSALAAGSMENPRVSPHYEVRERANYVDPQAWYWEGFELKNDGDCEAAVERLRPMANIGRGYESAQHALGLCLMSLGGLPEDQSTQFDTDQVSASDHFTEGRTWVLRAANAGHFQAQRTLLALYAVGLAENADAIEMSKWLRLYSVNPMRLTLGVGDPNDSLIRHLSGSVTPSALLAGKELARSWTPSYWTPPGVGYGD